MEQERWEKEQAKTEDGKEAPVEQNETGQAEPEAELMVQTSPLVFTVKLTAKDLWKFSLYHSNKGMLGIFNVIFSLAAIFLLVTTWRSNTVMYRALLIVCALMFTVSPVSEGGEAVEASGYPESNGSLLQQGRHRGDSGNGAAGAYLGKYRTGRADPGYDYCIHGESPRVSAS